ncbi:MAG: hypothetical protein AAGC67_15635 [Myxococcota bacterium]
MTHFLFLVHVAATWYLVGLCWLVQRVQYPLMAQVGREGFAAYEAAHVARIGPIVAPPMLIELGTGIALAATAVGVFRHPAFLLSLGLLAAIWASTFLLQVPLHGKLAAGFDADVHASLVATNWLRTLAWTARGVIVAWMAWTITTTAGATA